MSYQKLEVWQKSMELVVNIYDATRLFPKEEIFGLVSQMRRSAVSVPSNIAEGYGRKNSKENRQFVNIAYGSAAELETQIIISEKLNLAAVDWQPIKVKIEEVKKMLYKYREYLEKY